MKIAVAGTGYVGLSIATLLSQHHEVMAVDIVPEKVEKINNKISPIQDEYIEQYLAEKDLNHFFDTSAVESVIELVIKYNPNAVMVIKSTIPVGYAYGDENTYDASMEKNVVIGVYRLTMKPTPITSVSHRFRE